MIRFKLYLKDFVADLLATVTEERFATWSRMTGMLTMVLEELEDVPLYYELARLCNIVKLSQGKITAYLSAILNAGYRVSLTHANKVGLITCGHVIQTQCYCHNSPEMKLIVEVLVWEETQQTFWI